METICTKFMDENNPILLYLSHKNTIHLLTKKKPIEIERDSQINTNHSSPNWARVINSVCLTASNSFKIWEREREMGKGGMSLDDHGEGKDGEQEKNMAAWLVGLNTLKIQPFNLPTLGINIFFPSPSNTSIHFMLYINIKLILSLLLLLLLVLFLCFFCLHCSLIVKSLAYFILFCILLKDPMMSELEWRLLESVGVMFTTSR